MSISEALRKLEEAKTEKMDDISIMESTLQSLEKQYNEEKEVVLQLTCLPTCD